MDRRSPRALDGRIIDPNTGPFEGKPDLGHKPGQEFKTHKEQAQNVGLNQQQFNNKMNNPDLYQLENPSSNRSRRFEDKSKK